MTTPPTSLSNDPTIRLDHFLDGIVGCFLSTPILADMFKHQRLQAIVVFALNPQDDLFSPDFKGQLLVVVG